MMTELRVTIKNTSSEGGTFLTPVYFGFHDGAFDLFDVGSAASPGLESLAEDGSFAAIAAERQAVSPDSQGLIIGGASGPVPAASVATNRIIPGDGPQGENSNVFSVNGDVNQYVSFGAMILPSNDAFIGTDDAVRLFDGNGRFEGEQTIVFEGSDVYDAGTEVNTEEDAAFLNQSAPNTGVDEGGVIGLHPGFNGSAGNPVGEGAQNILGGTNAFGDFIDPVAADFTLPDAQIAVVHINTVESREGTDGRDVIIGRRDDDFIDAGAGNDFVSSGNGWDVINAGDGRDTVFGGRGDDEINGEGGNDRLFGGSGHDAITGGDGNDRVNAGSGNDRVDGGDGNDRLSGSRGDDGLAGGGGRDSIWGGLGDDLIAGGADNDMLRGGLGDDTFVFVGGDGVDTISDFRNNRFGDDTIALQVEGINDFDDVLASATDRRWGTTLDFGDDGTINLRGVDLVDLSSDDFIFG